MINFFKKLRKRDLPNDPITAAALFPAGSCRKTSVLEETSEQCLMEKDKDGSTIGDDDGFRQVGSASSNSEDEPVMPGLPKEPYEIDYPIRCPHPEPCIFQDGQALKQRLPSIKRRGQLPFLTKSEVQRSLWSSRSAPSDYRVASTPEPS